jgi:hypothetical protein
MDASLKATVMAEGIGALAFIPLTARGELVGKFMAYYATPHVFTDTDINIAVTVARQLGFGLERLGAEEQRRKAEEAKELLLGESKHRIKNTLAMVQAIANFVLDGKDIFKPSIITLCPPVSTSSSIDQLARNADAVAGTADTPFEDVADTQLTANLADIGRLALVLEARIASDDE